MTDEKPLEKKQPCPCVQEATDLLKAIQPIKDGMLKEVKCKGCGKTFLTNFDTEYCYDCAKTCKGENAPWLGLAPHGIPQSSQKNATAAHPLANPDALNTVQTTYSPS